MHKMQKYRSAPLTFIVHIGIMETFLKGFVSIMRDQIIYASILSLQCEGLKFSVDSLAKKLKISKKTIYKYFPNKEQLALAIYERYYLDAGKQVQAILNAHEKDRNSKLLHLYYESMKMIRSEIFNKYQLNEVVLSYAKQQNDALWRIISDALYHAKSEKTKQALEIIISGAFEKLYDLQDEPDAVIERLVMLL